MCAFVVYVCVHMWCMCVFVRVWCEYREIGLLGHCLWPRLQDIKELTVDLRFSVLYMAGQNCRAARDTSVWRPVVQKPLLIGAQWCSAMELILEMKSKTEYVCVCVGGVFPYSYTYLLIKGKYLRCHVLLSNVVHTGQVLQQHYAIQYVIAHEHI